MPSDLTTAEKAAALGLKQGEFSGDWCSQGHVYTARDVDALYAERFPALTLHGPTGWSVASTSPTPDYRAALEGLVEEIEELDLEDVEAACGDAQVASLRAALTHARKVLE